MKKIIIILILLFPCYSFAQQQKTELHGVKTDKKKENDTTEYILAGTFLVGQIFNTGNVIYQQETGKYYEINPIYGKHPGKDTVYIIKALETIAILGSAWLFKDHATAILIPANVVVLGAIAQDMTTFGVQAKVEW
ncbi:MAG: hypothetical protein A2163_00720 [Actinobacteria bacterium RBG_13_35_12]|nr:MAG: hypothetical protein A2163_00720 [Actinobacteria bacterium RBG_13_35_12]